MRNAAVILNSDDLMLSGEVYMPDDCERSYPAVCLCHGIPAVPYDPNERGGYPEMAARFCNAGFVALAFNFRGAGPSQGNIDMLGWTEDLASALEFLDMLPEVDKNRICLLGSSGGAAISVYVAARDPRVYAVATLACPAEFDFMSAGYTVDSMINSFREIGTIKDPDFPPSTGEWLEGFKTVSPIDYIDKISPRPLLIIHGDKDETVPVKHAGRLYDKAGSPKEMTILSGAGHRLRLDERAVKAALDWLTAQVKQ
ncbi:MAG: alpha/beta fold hydrolase [Dehalococcoidia bacterium]|nr:alpha/beta fold hydrolase [Dehalococcoidia bacterium]